MSDEPILTNREILRDIHTKVTRINSVVMGDPEAKQYGLVHKVNKLEKAEAGRSKFVMIISGISAGVALGISKFVEWWNK